MKYKDRQAQQAYEDYIAKAQKELEPLNKTELLQLLRELLDIRSHPGVSKKALIECLVAGENPELGGNPFDEERDIIMRFLGRNWDRIKYQLDPKCHGDCYQHSDMQVLACYLNSKKVLDREARHGEEED
jgi:hypothetical protein